MTFSLISLDMGSPLSCIYVIIYDRVFPRFPRPVKIGTNVETVFVLPVLKRGNFKGVHFHLISDENKILYNIYPFT